MKSGIGVMVAVLLACAVGQTALATEYRFEGGGDDGYDLSIGLRPVVEYSEERYLAGWYDGYALAIGTNLEFKAFAMVLLVR